MIFNIMTLAMTLTSYLQNLKIHSNKMAEKAMFESKKSGPSLLKKKTFSEKAEQRAVIKFCQASEKLLYNRDSQISETVGKT